ncbi:MAG: redoxin family protein [Alphaproteobacteria bacterium]|nr:redoxin family protein [Alphaproteobacteria bacterium]
MRATALLVSVSALLALTACDPDGSTKDDPVDSDGDGLFDDEEDELGTDPSNADTDGDGLSDSEEVNGGLDPLNPDSDLDNVSDGDEVSAGSDAMDCASVPDGHWPDCNAQAQADGVTGEGWSVGNVQNDWSAFDQFDQEINFHQFYGSIVVLDIAAGWCGPCNQAAPHQETFFQSHRADGVVVINLMIDDWSYDGNVTQGDFAADWADTHGLTFPVVVDTSYQGYAEAYYQYYIRDYVGGVPTFAVFDRDLRMVDVWSGENENRVTRNINDILEAEAGGE